MRFECQEKQLKELEQFQINNVVFKNRNTDNSMLSNLTPNQFGMLNMSLQLYSGDRYERKAESIVSSIKGESHPIDRSL